MANEKNTFYYGMILMFVGGILTIIGGILIGIINIFSPLLETSTEDMEFLISIMVLVFGIICDILGLLFYSAVLEPKDQQKSKPHVVSRQEFD